MSIQFRIVQDHSPGVDIDHRTNPFSLIEEKCHCIFILSVKILLVTHFLSVITLHKQGIIRYRNTEHILTGLAVSYMKYR